MPRSKRTSPRRSSNSPHTQKPIYRRDALFRSTATLPEVYKEILRKHLPKELLDKLDIQKARLINPCTVDKHLRARLADIALEIPFASGNGTCCVAIEQQTQGPFLPQRALEYQTRFVKAIKKEKGDDHPVAVCTIVLHSTHLPHTQATHIFAGLSNEEQHITRKYLGSIHAVELANIPDAQLNDSTACGVLEILLKHRRGTRMLPTLGKLWQHLKQIKKTSQGQEFVDTALNYALLAAQENERCDILKHIGEQLGNHEEEKIMTVATALKREGRQEGRQKGRQEGLKEGKQKGEQIGVEKMACRMLCRGMQTKDVMEITHLSRKRILELQTQLKQQATHKTS